MDVTLPNGTVLKGVPDGTSKEDIMRKAITGGYAEREDFSIVEEKNKEEPARNRVWGDDVIDYVKNKAQEGWEYATENPMSAALAIADPIGFIKADPQVRESVQDAVLPGIQGATFQGGDNIYATGAAVLDQILGSDNKYWDDYEKRNKEYLNKVDAANDRSPMTAKGAEIVGAYLGPGKIFNAVSNLSRAKQLALLTGEAALYEGGKADTFEELPGRMVTGGAYGLGGGVAMQGIGKALPVLGKAYSKYRKTDDAVEEVVGPVGKKVIDAGRTASGDPTPTANKVIDYFKNSGKNVAEKVDKRLSDGTEVNTIDDFTKGAKKHLGNIAEGKFWQATPGKYGDFTGALQEATGRLGVAKLGYASGKSLLNNLLHTTPKAMSKNTLDVWGRPLKAPQQSPVMPSQKISNQRPPQVEPKMDLSDNDLLKQIRARRAASGVKNIQKTPTAPIGQSADNYVDQSKQAQMHLLNLNKRFTKGEIPEKVVRDAEGLMAKGKYDDVIDIGASMKKQTQAEINAVEKQMKAQLKPSVSNVRVPEDSTIIRSMLSGAKDLVDPDAEAARLLAEIRARRLRSLQK